MTDTTTTPAWINVDALVPEALRAEIADLTRQAESIRDTLAPLAERAAVAIRTVDEECRDANAAAVCQETGWIDGVGYLVGEVSGQKRLMQVLAEISDLAGRDV